jgi:hypothetical protein
VPWASTAIAGSNANAGTSGSAMVVQVRPPSRDLRMPIAPEVGDRLSSKAM